MKITPGALNNENELIQMIKLGKYIRHKWVKEITKTSVKYLSPSLKLDLF